MIFTFSIFFIYVILFEKFTLFTLIGVFMAEDSRFNRGSRFLSLKSVHEKVLDDVGSSNFNWREAISEPMRNGDLDGMKKVLLPMAELNMAQLACSAESETVRYQANAFLLAQKGHGPMQRIEHTIDYSKLPEDQLQSIVQSKIASIKRLNPAFDLKSILPEGTLEADFSEVNDSSVGSEVNDSSVGVDEVFNIGGSEE